VQLLDIIDRDFGDLDVGAEVRPDMQSDE